MHFHHDKESRSKHSSVVIQAAGHTISLRTNEKFPVTPYTRFLLSNIPNLSGLRVLDFGCGSGAISIAAALSSAASVLACDLNLEALSFVKLNAERLDCFQVEVAQVKAKTATVLEGRRFDVILCNPASLPAATSGDRFWYGGRYGTDMIFRLISIADQHLEKSGELIFVHTSLASLQRSLRRLVAAKMSYAIVARTQVPFREHYADLLPHFLALRGKGEIFFDTAGGTTCEYLYLIQAKRFCEESI